MANPTTPYGVVIHQTANKVSSFKAKVALVTADPVKISTADVNTVVKCAANDPDFVGVSKEDKAAGLAVGIDESDYFVGKIGTGGVTLGAKVKTDGSGAFIVGTASGDYQVAEALTAGSAGEYVEFRRLPAIVKVP